MVNEIFDVAWNCVRGCSRVSEGCRNCSSARSALRVNGELRAYSGLVEVLESQPAWTGELRFSRKTLDRPYHLIKPRRIMINTMSDLFHEEAHDGWIEQILRVVDDNPRHTFQVLTKRAARMKSIMERLYPQPLPNLWLGVSVESEAEKWRIIPLLETPAATRWVAVEPMLGPVDISWALEAKEQPYKLDLVMVGGEIGPYARPLHPDWVRSIRDQCSAAGVPFYFKTWGEYLTAPLVMDPRYPGGAYVQIEGYARMSVIAAHNWRDGLAGVRVGKPKTCRLLDGRVWDELPGGIQKAA